MRIAVVGATGRVGTAVVEEALARGHEISAIARGSGGIAPRPRLAAVAADIYDTARAAAALAGHDAIVSAFNPGWGDPEIRARMGAGTRSILDAARAAGVRRILIVGGAGSLLAADGSRLVDSPNFPERIRAGALGAADALDIVRGADDLDWTFLSPPPALAPGPRTGAYRAGADTPVTGADGTSTVSDADLAVAVLDEIERPAHVRRRFTVGY